MSGIEVKNVTKNFGNVCALQDVHVQFEKNKIYGLLGRNGAGKSTLLNVITGRIFADQGEVLLDEDRVLENDEALQKLFMMSEKNYYPESMKVSDAIKWTGEFYSHFDKDTAVHLAERFALPLNKKIKSLSTGYGTIFKLVIALSVNTSYLLLDEPVLGLDANHRDLLYRILIERYLEKPCTIILSTHLIEEIAGVIENVVIIKDGKIIHSASKEELLSQCYMVSGTTAVIDRFIQNQDVIGTDTLGGLKTAYIRGALDKGSIPEGVETAGINLQKLFILLTNS